MQAGRGEAAGGGGDDVAGAGPSPAAKTPGSDVAPKLCCSACGPCAAPYSLDARSNAPAESWDRRPLSRPCTLQRMRSMREPLIVTALFSIYVGTRSTAKAIGALQRLYV
jgi:hypothetical protein